MMFRGKVPMRNDRNSAETRVGKRRGLFWGDTQGAAAVEFGFLAPVLLLMLLGTIETARAVSTDRHFTVGRCDGRRPRRAREVPGQDLDGSRRRTSTA